MAIDPQPGVGVGPVEQTGSGLVGGQRGGERRDRRRGPGERAVEAGGSLVGQVERLAGGVVEAAGGRRGGTAGRRRAPPCSASPTIGMPRAAAWMRTWCVRPVWGRASQRSYAGPALDAARSRSTPPAPDRRADRRRSADRSVSASGRDGSAVDQQLVALVDGSRRPLPAHRAVGGGRLPEHEQARGRLVQPVQDRQRRRRAAVAAPTRTCRPGRGRRPDGCSRRRACSPTSRCSSSNRTHASDTRRTYATLPGRPHPPSAADGHPGSERWPSGHPKARGSPRRMWCRAHAVRFHGIIDLTRTGPPRRRAAVGDVTWSTARR